MQWARREAGLFHASRFGYEEVVKTLLDENKGSLACNLLADAVFHALR